MSTGDESYPGQELSSEEYRAILSGAADELLAYVRRTVDDTTTLLEIMASGQEVGTGHGEAAEPQAPSASGYEPAAAVIAVRIRARHLAGVLDGARSHARNLPGAPTVQNHKRGSRHTSRKGARARNEAPTDDQAPASIPTEVFLAYTLVNDIVRALNRALVRADAHDPNPTFIAGISDDLDLSLAFVLATDTRAARIGGLIPAEDVETIVEDLNRALITLMELQHELDAMQVDASGADLSHLDLSDLDVLVGITWTQETKWPADKIKRIRAMSEEIRPGVYRVGSGIGDPAELVTV